MGFFSKLFKKDDTDIAKKEKNSKIDNTDFIGVPYNEGLIETLLKDHKDLVAEFTKISQLAQNKKYKTLKQYLKSFKVNLEIHNYSEKIQLYTYLKNYYKNENEERFIEDMFNSAKEIYNDVFAFLKKYETIEFNDQYQALFLNELEAVGKILQSRIEVEESELYSLYKR